MIEYHRLETKEADAPRGVRVVTDDRNSELAHIIEILDESNCEEFDTYKNVQSVKEVDGKFDFLIPGNEVGEISDLFWDIDNGKLEKLVEEWNEQMIDELDA